MQLRDAAGKFGDQLPEIIVTGDADFHNVHAAIDTLSRRIEVVVQDLQQRDRELLRAGATRGRGQLAAGVAHEIRNPFDLDQVLVQSVREDGNGLQTEDLAVIEAEVRRMERSLNTFLEFARPPKLHRSTTSLELLLLDVVKCSGRVPNASKSRSS